MKAIDPFLAVTAISCMSPSVVGREEYNKKTLQREEERVWFEMEVHKENKKVAAPCQVWSKPQKFQTPCCQNILKRT